MENNLALLAFVMIVVILLTWYMNVNDNISTACDEKGDPHKWKEVIHELPNGSKKWFLICDKCKRTPGA